VGNYKECPKNNVLSIRVTDKEKAFIDEIMRRTKKNISTLMREALSHYDSGTDIMANH